MNGYKTAFSMLPRSAGVLLHITSLPGAMDLGDLGPAAYHFVDFLVAAGQRFWQILPVNPTSSPDAWSPYSSTSSFAGNPLLISPELLARDGYLSQADVSVHKTADTPAVDFRRSEQLRDHSLRKAHKVFCERPSTERSGYEEFCSANADWLTDFVLFSVARQSAGERSWEQWPDQIRTRNRAALQQLEKDNPDIVLFVRWQQYIFHRQWNQLKQYANDKGVRLIGDMPIYVGYNSADVWANQKYFNLSPAGTLQKVAGTPADKFNADGQRWGMPTYRWDDLKATHYSWFTARVRKALTFVDLLRLDHFRGFSAYWEIDANESSAAKGQWITGPSDDLFQELKKNFPLLPFIAEDLGHIDEDVYRLRNAFKLPGMEVLTFAFPKPEEPNIHIPHNHDRHAVVYTGTHDTDTVVGWYKALPLAEQQMISQYFGMNLTELTVADFFCRVAYQSVSSLCILPLQDILALDETARMNNPARPDANWLWRGPAESLSPSVISRLAGWCQLYEREELQNKIK